MGKDNWHTTITGERYDGSALSGERLGGGLLEGQLDGVLPRPEGGRGVGDDLREPRERIRKGCLEGILQGRSGEGRLGTDVRRTRGKDTGKDAWKVYYRGKELPGASPVRSVPRDSW